MNTVTLKRSFKQIALSASALIVFANAQGQTINTIAGTGTGGYAGDGGAATAANFNSPCSIKIDAAGNKYIADYLNHRIRKIDVSGNVTTIAGNGSAGYSGDGGAATAASIRQPAGVAVDAAGNLYISDYINNRIRKVNASGIITTVAGNGTGSYTGDGGPATAATINGPTGINVDTAGNVYFAEENNHVIRKITVSTGVISTVAGTGIAGYSTGIATMSNLRQPKDVVVDASGNLYIADWTNHRIRMVNTSGTISNIAGDGTFGFSGDGYSATSCQLRFPIAVWIDNAGNLLVADNGNSRIRKIFLSGAGHIATISGNGTFSFTGDGGPATAAGLNSPIGIVTDASGIIYVADEGNHRIRKIATVAPPPPPFIAGTTSLCAGATTTLGASVSGGTWTSGSTTIATINASGVVTAITAGTTIITYITATGIDTALISVHPQPAAITGPGNVCLAGTASYTCSPSGGTWTSSIATNVSINAAGIATGVSLGTSVLTYTGTGGCYSTLGITVVECPTETKILTGLMSDGAAFPNPCKGTFTIHIPSPYTHAHVSLTDLLGRKIKDVVIPASPSSELTHTFSGIPVGVYIASIATDNYHRDIKIIVTD